MSTKETGTSVTWYLLVYSFEQSTVIAKLQIYCKLVKYYIDTNILTILYDNLLRRAQLTWNGTYVTHVK